MSEFITVSQADGVLSICLNRAEKKNALDTGMYQALADAINDANSDDDTRVVLIRAKGDAFCGGNDLKDFLDNPPVDQSAPVFLFIAALVNAEKPLIAAVNGMAVGIGTTMLLHCDLVYAGESAVFSLPFVNLGVCPEAGSSLLLPMLCGHRKAAEYLLGGESFDVQEAKQIGLVNQISTDDNLQQIALANALKLAGKPENAVRATKRLLKAPIKDQLEQVIEAEAKQFLLLLNADESKNIVAAFFNR